MTEASRAAHRPHYCYRERMLETDSPNRALINRSSNQKTFSSEARIAFPNSSRPTVGANW